MQDQILIATTIIAGLGLVTLAALHGWQGWLSLKERELEQAPMRPGNHLRDINDNGANGSTALGSARIEIADLKERIRKLEAIASGVDL